jgi:hypothetical protein
MRATVQADLPVYSDKYQHYGILDQLSLDPGWDLISRRGLRRASLWRAQFGRRVIPLLASGFRLPASGFRFRLRLTARSRHRCPVKKRAFAES